MRHLQVTESVFSNPDELINLRFNTDLCDYLCKNYGGSALFQQMGAYSIISNMNAPFAQALALNTSVKDLHAHFIEGVLANHWEQNCRYRILKMTNTSLIAESIPNPDVAVALKTRHPGSALVCQTKVGIVSSVPGYLDLPFSHAEEISCVHRGDERCIYEVNFEFSAQQLKLRQKNGNFLLQQGA
jgi:hypothetical protein